MGCLQSRHRLHDAAAYGKLERVKRLLAGGADVNAKDDDGLTPLHWAAETHCILEDLLRDPRETVHCTVHCSALVGHVDVAHVLLENGADVNAKHKDGGNPLHWAAMRGCGDVAQVLLENGADINAKNDDGLTPLHLAADCDKADVARVLLKNGADVNVKNKDGNTPLHFAAESYPSGADVAALLLKNDADVNAKNNADETLLHVVAAKGFFN